MNLKRIRTKDKWLTVLVVVIMVLILIVFISALKPKLKTDSKASLSSLDSSIGADDIEDNADAYKGKVVQVSGRIFSLEKSGNTSVMQIYTDSENSKGNFIITAVNAPSLSEDDYVKVIGEVQGLYKGENAFNATISVPAITALQVTIIDRNQAAAPALKTKNINQTIDRGGVSVTLESIDYAKQETRLNVKVANQSGDTASFYSFNSKLIQNGSQIKDKSVYDSKNKYDIPSEIVNGTSEKGVIFFERSDPEKPSVVHFEAYSTKDYSTLEFDFPIQ